jgi:preprotein translocase subunit SecG
MTTFVTIIYVIVALMMVLAILLQAGKGGGLGTALGGGASQGVFGSGGGADFMSKLTQGFAATFMISAMYLAYASAHAGSEFLEQSDEGSEGLLEDDQDVDPERLGPRPQPLPTPDEAKQLQAKAEALVPALSEAPPELLQPPVAEPTPPAEPAPTAAGGNTPDADRGIVPQADDSSLTEAADHDESPIEAKPPTPESN